MASPICLVQDASGPFLSTLDGVNVTSGDTITIKLFDISGVVSWSVACLSTDELSSTSISVTSNGVSLPTGTINVGTTSGFNNTGTFLIKELGAVITYTGKTSTSFTGCTGGTGILSTGQKVSSVNVIINQVAKTATFVAPGPGSALIFQSIINGGVDVQGTIQPTYTTTFGVFVLTATSFRVGATGETTEGDSVNGWTSKVNQLIRSYTGSSASAGDGLVFSTGAYNVVSADSSIVVNADNIQFKTAFTTLLNSATSAATNFALVQRDSAGAINLSGPNGGAKYEGSITVTPSSGFNLIQTGQTSDIVTNALTIQTQGAFASATGANRKPGDLNLTINAPSNSGTTDGFVNIKIASVTQIALGRNNTTSSGLINFPGSGELTTSGGGSLSLNTSTIKYGISGSTTSIQPANNTTNGATGDQTIFSAMDCTGTTSTGGDLIVASGTGTTANGSVKINSGSTTRIQANGTGLGFFNATPIAKPTVTGAKGGNAALASLLTQLVSLGLITDSSTA